MLPVLRRQVGHRSRQVSWLGGAAIAANRFAFPSGFLSGTSKRRSSLQWRDRAGVTPASLLSPRGHLRTLRELHRPRSASNAHHGKYHGEGGSQHAGSAN